MSTESAVCTCGALKVRKVGTHELNGLMVCNACKKAVEVTAASVAAAAALSISSEMVTTLEGVPGYRVTDVHGVVTELASAAGFTAASKGRDALSAAMSGLQMQAARRSANAIVGLQVSTFGAAGGITHGLGGDAVGVLLVGTAVTVVPQVEAAEGHD